MKLLIQHFFQVPKRSYKLYSSQSQFVEISPDYQIDDLEVIFFISVGFENDQRNVINAGSYIDILPINDNLRSHPLRFKIYFLQEETFQNQHVIICHSIYLYISFFFEILIEAKTRQYQPPQMPSNVGGANELFSLVKVSIFLYGAAFPPT